MGGEGGVGFLSFRLFENLIFLLVGLKPPPD